VSLNQGVNDFILRSENDKLRQERDDYRKALDECLGELVNILAEDGFDAERVRGITARAIAITRKYGGRVILSRFCRRACE
jgi:hypothetical protein